MLDAQKVDTDIHRCSCANIPEVCMVSCLLIPMILIPTSRSNHFGGVTDLHGLGKFRVGPSPKVGVAVNVYVSVDKLLKWKYIGR